MKLRQFFIVAAMGVAFVSCEKQIVDGAIAHPEKNAVAKTAYIDTERLMKEYEESKDFETKYQAMSERMQNELDSDMKKFQRDVADLQKNAQSKGMQWAQERQAQLERRQQTLMEKEQNYMKKFQEEGAVERDSLVSKMKNFIKTYGADNGYDYIYGTGDAATVLFAKDEYEITDTIIQLMNEAYNKSSDEDTQEEAKEETSEESTEKKADNTK